MASIIQKPVKQLAELLQEQQEPFVLEVYLFERGYLRKSLSSNREGGSSFCKTFNRSSSWGLSKSKKGALSCSRVLRSVYNKLVSRNSGPSNKSSENKEAELNADTKMRRKNQEIVDSDRFSSASSRTQYDSCSEDEKDEASVSLQNDHKASLVADTSQVSKPCNMIKEREIEQFNGGSLKSHRKQQNPVSVLKDTPPSHADAVQELPAMSRKKESPCPSTCNFKIADDSIVSASLWELLFQPALEKPRGSGVSEKLEPVRSNINPSPHFAKSKRVLQQTRQLLFDCVREMTETHAKKEREKQRNCIGFLGAEEIGNLLYEKLGTWGNQAGHEANINFVLELDLLGSAEEWSNNYQERREIGNEIGDTILEEIIEEIVAEK